MLFRSTSLPPGQITPELLEQMKQQARELAVAQYTMQKMNNAVEQPKVVYVRRNFTVAELLLILFLSCGIVTVIQAGWHLVTQHLPKIEVRVK